MIQSYLRVFIFLACVLTSWSMNAEKYWLSHCQGELPGNASPVIEGEATVSVATLFSAEELAPVAANNITTLRFGLVSKLKLNDVTVWITTGLDQEPLRRITIAKNDLKSGWNEVELDNPLLIDGQPLYIGYTFSQPSKCNVIPVYTGNGSYPLWLDNGEGWNDITSEYPGALCVEAGIEGSNLADHELKITAVKVEYPVVETGAIAYLRVDFTNTGIVPFSHISYTVSHPSGSIEGEAEIPFINPREKGSFRVWLPLGEACEPHPATVRVTAIEGDSLTTFPEGEVMLTVAEAPFLERNVLLEDFSNEFCGNCPDAAVAIEKTIESLQQPFRLNLVTHHAGSSYDPFTIDASKEYECFYTGSRYSPMALFDRTYVNGEINIIPSTETIVRQSINAELLRDAEASLYIIPYMDIEKGLVEVEAHGMICENRLVNLTLFVTEDNVPAIHQSGVSGEYFHNALLRSVGPVWGTPVNTDADATYRCSSRAVFNNEWKRDDCRIIAFLTDNDPASATYRSVLQSISLPLAYAKETRLDDAGIEKIENGISDINLFVDNGHLVISGDYVSVNVFSTDGIEISAQCIPSGISIVRILLPDGNILTKKIIN